MNTEDVLLDELDHMDGHYSESPPSLPPFLISSLDSLDAVEGSA
ncbi:hypothetical protein HaLaN_22212, partial [Haematococcus lacustris]